MIQTVDNFNGLYANTSHDNSKVEIEKCEDKLGYSCRICEKYNEELHISLYQYLQKENYVFISLRNKVLQNSEDELIISCLKSVDRESEQDYLSVKTGNYIGKFVWNYPKNKQVTIDIKSRFSNIFLKRMLNFANDVYLDDVDVSGEIKKDKYIDYSKFIIYYMFTQKLEKAFLLGLPKAYVSISHHEMKLKGKIDINRYIKYDIPFKGKISSTSREQKEIQEIIDVLYKAINIIEKNNFNTKNIIHIKTHLKQNRSNKYVSNETISKAIKSKALLNPIFTSYKKVLEYAKLIIDANNLEAKKDANKETFGFLVNVAELFEIYLVKLLQLRMLDWKVIHEDTVTVYKKQFYQRHMYPDIIMENKYNNKIMAFDVKYKRMNFNPGIGDGKYGDLDRSDFFQINTYMTYYDKQGYEVIAGGLLYPMESDIKETEKTIDRKAHAYNWFGDAKTKFIVDGIDLSKEDLTMDDIQVSEDAFIERIIEMSGDISI